MAGPCGMWNRLRGTEDCIAGHGFSPGACGLHGSHHLQLLSPRSAAGAWSVSSPKSLNWLITDISLSASELNSMGNFFTF